MSLPLWFEWFPTPFPIVCVTYLFRRYSPLSLEVAEKTEEMQKFVGAQFLWEGQLRLFYGSLLGRLTTHYLAKFG